MPLRITPFSPLANASQLTIHASREIRTLAISNSDTQARIKTAPHGELDYPGADLPWYERQEDSQCIASNDPRLKGAK